MSDRINTKRSYWVNPAALENAQETRSRNFFLELSPYDLPRLIRFEVDSVAKILALDFEYIDQERSVKSATSNQVQMLVGKHTGKVLRVIVPIERFPISAVELKQIRDSIREAIRSSPPHNASGAMNRKVSDEIIEENFDQIAGDMVG